MNEWWGYIHTNESIQVKRYFDYLDIQEARDSPFVSRVYGPFFADSRDHAIQIVKGKDEWEMEKKYSK